MMFVRHLFFIRRFFKILNGIKINSNKAAGNAKIKILHDGGSYMFKLRKVSGLTALIILFVLSFTLEGQTAPVINNVNGTFSQGSYTLL